MKRLSISMIAGGCLAGLLGGWAVGRFHGSRANAGARAETAEVMSVPHRTARARPVPSESPRSTETYEDVSELVAKEAANPAAYERLALWLLDANAEEIAALWARVPRPVELHKETIDLIFVFWTALDPEAAIAATAGTPQEGFAWWAWACHDPRRALDEAQLRNTKRLSDVGWGIGEFHPQWLRDHHKEIPDGVSVFAFSGLGKWVDGLDPLEELRVSRETKRGISHEILCRAARLDPEAAWGWVKEQRGLIDPENLARLAHVLEEFHPEVLARILGEPEASELKRALDDERFLCLVKEDPAAAWREAEANGEPRLVTTRLTAVGLSLVGENPEEAFRLAQRMLELDPDALFAQARQPDESVWTSRRENEEAGRLMTALLARDPERVMAILPPDDNASLAMIWKTWAAWDPAEYASWVTSGADPSFRDEAVGILIGRLSLDDDYAEAAEWSLSLPAPDVDSLRSLFEQWRTRDPFAAKGWLERADLPNATKQQIRTPRREGG